MNITPNKENEIFRPEGPTTLNAHEGNQIIAEIMSVIDWAIAAGFIVEATDNPESPQMVEALQAMLYSREAGEALELLSNTLAGKKVLIHNGTEYAYIDFKDLNNDTQALVEENALDEKLAAAISGVLHFVGYVTDTEPPDAKEGELWIVGNTMPTTFPVAAQKMTAGEWVDTEYTPSIFDLWANMSDGHGYYWFGDMWNLLDFDVDLSQFYTKIEIDALLAEKQRTIIAGVNLTKTATPEGDRLDMAIPDITLAPKSKGEMFYSFSDRLADNPGSVRGWTGELQRPTDSGYSIDFYNWLKNNHPELITTWADYQSRISQNGSCSLYVLDYDTIAGSILTGAIKFPTLSNYIRGPRGVEAVSTELGDAIRNITGKIPMAVTASNPDNASGGSFYDSGTTGGSIGYSLAGAARIAGFDASRVVPTAEENRPKTQILYPWICIANAQIVKSVQFIPQEGPLEDISNLQTSVADLQGAVGFTPQGKEEIKKFVSGYEFDTGWVSISNNQVYPFTHNLGTYDWEEFLEFKTDNGAYWVRLPVNQYGDASQYNNIILCKTNNENTCAIVTGANLLHGVYLHNRNTGTRTVVNNIQSGQCRLRLRKIAQGD